MPMFKNAHLHGTDLRGYGRLAIDATLGITGLVETLHHNILRSPGVFGTATQEPARGITGFVYRSIRGVTRLVGGGVDVLLGRLAPLIGDVTSSPTREALLSALNGVLGDHLESKENPLAISMQLRRDGTPLELDRGALGQSIPEAGGKLLVLVHGLCMNDRQWRRNSHDHGAALARDRGYTPVYLHYNSGLPIGSNGIAFAQQMDALVRAWPVPLEELVVLGHSMGGLVARSACEHAREAGQSWLARLDKLIFLGTPHLGAPLERGGNWIDTLLDASPYTTAFARLGKIRSAGITDLRHGSVSRSDGRHRFQRAAPRPRHVPLPVDVACYAIAASLAKKSGTLAEKMLGDGLVPLKSALGQGSRRDLALPKSHQWTGYGINHMDLLDRPEVYERLLRWL
jgi:pimeloyl-ACP methyl ester carboxylesterase